MFRPALVVLCGNFIRIAAAHLFWLGENSSWTSCLRFFALSLGCSGLRFSFLLATVATAAVGAGV